MTSAGGRVLNGVDIMRTRVCAQVDLMIGDSLACSAARPDI